MWDESYSSRLIFILYLAVGLYSSFIWLSQAKNYMNYADLGVLKKAKDGLLIVNNFFDKVVLHFLVLNYESD